MNTTLNDELLKIDSTIYEINVGLDDRPVYLNARILKKNPLREKGLKHILAIEYSLPSASYIDTLYYETINRENLDVTERVIGLSTNNGRVIMTLKTDSTHYTIFNVLAKQQQDSEWYFIPSFSFTDKNTIHHVDVPTVSIDTIIKNKIQFKFLNDFETNYFMATLPDDLGTFNLSSVSFLDSRNKIIYLKDKGSKLVLIKPH